MSSEIKSNFNKIPVDKLKNNPDLSDEEKKNFQQGEDFILGLIGGKEKIYQNNKAPLEESGKIVSYENLRQLYDTELKKSISSIEKERKTIARTFILALLIFILSFIAFILIDSIFYLNIITGISALIFSAVLFVKGIIHFLKFRGKYKSAVVEKIIHFINPKYQYEPNNHIKLDDFILSKLINANINKAIGDDYIRGKIDKTIFEFSEFAAQLEYETKDEKGRKVKQIDTYFNGLFFFADFHKHIHGETFLVPDNAERILGKFGQKFQRSSKGELVKLENPEFEKYFAVFSTDQTEARYILTPVMMEGLINIRKKINADISFSFIGERVYCGIEFNKALFEASIFRPARFADIEFMYSLFSLIQTIVTEMNLNSRIWTKK